MSDQRTFCKAKNKKGQPCQASATESGYCYLHTNPDMAAELGRAGGRKNRHVVDDDFRPLPPMDTITGVKDAVVQMIRDVYSRDLHPRTAAGVAPLLNTLLRALGESDHEQRIKQLEKQLSELSEGVPTGLANEKEEDSGLQN
jgi:Family of unknown function (DUF5763)